MAGRKPQGLTLTFTEDELDVVITALSRFAREADWDEEYDDEAGTVAATLIDRIASELPATPSGPAPRARRGDGPQHGTIRKAIHAETKLALRYVDRKGKESRRVICPSNSASPEPARRSELGARAAATFAISGSIASSASTTPASATRSAAGFFWRNYGPRSWSRDFEGASTMSV